MGNCPVSPMKIRAKQQFSHFYLGTVDQNETRVVAEEVGKALVGMKLAEEVKAAGSGDTGEPEAEKPSKKSAEKK